MTRARPRRRRLSRVSVNPIAADEAEIRRRLAELGFVLIRLAAQTNPNAAATALETK